MKKSRLLGTFCAGLMMIGVYDTTSAALVNFIPTGNANVTGYIQFDDTNFNGTTNQLTSNSLITDLFLVVSGFTFSLADVVTNAATIIDSSAGSGLRVLNGDGSLAHNGPRLLAFLPGSDGDASLYLNNPVSFFEPLWVPQAVVPIPAAAWLFGSGLLGLVRLATRRKKSV